jgi:hypothetical protein
VAGFQIRGNQQRAVEQYSSTDPYDLNGRRRLATVAWRRLLAAGVADA